MKISKFGALSLGLISLSLAPLPSNLPVLGTVAALAQGGQGGDHGGGGGNGGGNGHSRSGQSGSAISGNSGTYRDKTIPHTSGKIASDLGGLNAYHALLNGNAGAHASPNSTVGMIQQYVNDMDQYMYDQQSNLDTTTDQSKLSEDLESLAGKVNKPDLTDATSDTYTEFNNAIESLFTPKDFRTK